MSPGAELSGQAQPSMLVTRPAYWSASLGWGAVGMYQPGVPARAFSAGTGPVSARPAAGRAIRTTAARAARAAQGRPNTYRLVITG